jgi:phage protein U
MTEVMMKLSEYSFSVEAAAYQALRRVHEYRWAAQARFGRKDALQNTGPGSERIELNGIIYPHFKGGLGQINAMRSEADKGEPLILVDGTMKVWGKYVITRIEETQTVLNERGQPRKQTFRLELSAYGDDA